MTVPSYKTSGVFMNGLQGATPKYALNQGVVENDFRETMARVFINSPKSVTARLAALPESVASAAARIYQNGYIDFLLQSVNTGLQEKVDVSENLADGYVAYFMGQAPQTLQCGGMLLNSRQDDQVVSLIGLYREILRGTKLAEHGETVRLRFDSYLYTGYFSTLNWSLGAENELACPFGATFMVKRLDIVRKPVFVPTEVEALPDSERGAVDAVGPTLLPQRVVGTAPPATVAPPAAPAEVDPGDDPTVNATWTKQLMKERLNGAVVDAPPPLPVMQVRGPSPF